MIDLSNRRESLLEERPIRGRGKGRAGKFSGKALNNGTGGDVGDKHLVGEKIGRGKM